MAYNFSFSFGKSQLPSYVERDASGSYWYQITDFFNGTKKNKFKSEKARINAVLLNPAALRVSTLLADITSQGKVESYVNDQLKDNNWLYTLSNRPNEWQTWTDFLYDYQFFRFLGNAYLYVSGDVMYFLNPIGLNFTDSQIKSFQNLSLSKYGANTQKNTKKGTFEYTQQNGVTLKLDFANLYVISDISNNISGNWLVGNSKLDALYNVVLNSELSVTSKGKNLEYTQKFFATGQHNPSDIVSTPMSDNEKESIERAFNSNRQIHATKSKVDFNHLVSDMNKLKLNEAYTHDLLVIADMYGVPKELIGVLQNGSTYENQEKATGRLIDYTIRPACQQLTDTLEIIFNQEDLRTSFKHLPFNAVFEAEKITNQGAELNNLKTASELGLPENVKQDKLKAIYGY
jgi:HK97 family phage portal protein